MSRNEVIVILTIIVMFFGTIGAASTIDVMNEKRVRRIEKCVELGGELMMFPDYPQGVCIITGE